MITTDGFWKRITTMCILLVGLQTAPGTWKMVWSVLLCIYFYALALQIKEEQRKAKKNKEHI